MASKIVVGARVRIAGPFSEDTRFSESGIYINKRMRTTVGEEGIVTNVTPDSVTVDLGVSWVYPITTVTFVSPPEVAPHPNFIRSPDQFGPGLFRINGLYEDKARVCKVHYYPRRKVVEVHPVDKGLDSKVFTVDEMVNKLKYGEIRAMCLERFE